MSFSDLSARIASAIRACDLPARRLSGDSSSAGSPPVLPSIDFTDCISLHQQSSCAVYDYSLERLGTWALDLAGRMSRVRYSGAAHDDEADDHEWRDVLTKGDSCLVMVDCETSGTASILPIFLIGSLWWDDDSVYARQWLARDYSEECAMLASFAKCMNETDVMFTYNGRTFDVPYMKSRCCFHGISFPAIRHVDLLPIARKRWRDRLPNFQLRTIETNLCGRDRIEDLPSAHVPMCYHAHVQDPASHSIAPVLRHNLTDVMTLLETICLLFESRM